MLTLAEQKLLLRYLVQLLQLQARGATGKEFQIWRQRVETSFPTSNRKKI